MKRMFAVLGCLLAGAFPVSAATVLSATDATIPYAEVTSYVQLDGQWIEVGEYDAVDSGDGKTYSIKVDPYSDYQISISATFNNDPFIIWTLGAINPTGSPLPFMFVFTTSPLAAGIYGDATSSFSVSGTDTFRDGITITSAEAKSTVDGTSTNTDVGPLGGTFGADPNEGSYSFGTDSAAASFGPLVDPFELKVVVTFTIGGGTVDGASLDGATTITAVPEPATLMLLGTMLTGFGFVVRRKSVS